jgi:hypothetical protein
MNRRSFLKLSSISAALVGSGLWLSETINKSNNDVSFSELSANVQSLYSQKFVKALPHLSLGSLLAKLSDKSVYREGEFYVNQVQANSNSDSLVEFGNFYYTESELYLYSIVARLYVKSELLKSTRATTEDIVELAGVDFMGGDLKNFKTNVGGVDQCEEACEAELNCNAYTYAKTSHPIPSKQGHCWLKQESFIYKKDGNYISGIKR